MEKVLEGPQVHFNAGEGCQVNWSTVGCLHVLERCCVVDFPMLIIDFPVCFTKGKGASFFLLPVFLLVLCVYPL